MRWYRGQRGQRGKRRQIGQRWDREGREGKEGSEGRHDREGKEDRKVKMSSVLLGQAGTNGVERLTDDQILDQANTITNVRSIKGRIFEKSKCV